MSGRVDIFVVSTGVAIYYIADTKLKDPWMKDLILNFIREHEGCLASEIATEFRCGGEYALEVWPNALIWRFNDAASTAILGLVDEREIVLDAAPAVAMMTGPLVLKMKMLDVRTAKMAKNGRLKTPRWVPAVFYSETYARQQNITPMIGQLKV